MTPKQEAMPNEADVAEEGDDSTSGFVTEREDGGITINWDDIPESGGFEALPRGKYDVVVDEAEYKLSQNSSQPMWALVLVVEGGQYDKQKLFTNISFSPKALPITKRTIAQCWPHLLTSGFDPEKIDDYGVQGSRLSARTKIQKYEGDDLTRVREL